MKYENKMYRGEILEFDDKLIKRNAIEHTVNENVRAPNKKDMHDYT